MSGGSYINEAFDKETVLSKISNIEDQISKEKEKMPSKERDDEIRRLMYAQLMMGLRLNTGYCHL